MSETLSYTIRPGRLADISYLGAIEKRAGELFKSVGLALVAEGEPLPLDFTRSFLSTGTIAIAADAKDQPVGFALASQLDQALHLYEISVHPDHGQQGLGKGLLDAIEAYAKERRLPAMTLSTFKDVPWNAPFYARHGFRILDKAEWTPALFVLRLREEDGGLPINRRCFMRKVLA